MLNRRGGDERKGAENTEGRAGDHVCEMEGGRRNGDVLGKRCNNKKCELNHRNSLVIRIDMGVNLSKAPALEQGECALSETVVNRLHRRLNCPYRFVHRLRFHSGVHR